MKINNITEFKPQLFDSETLILAFSELTLMLNKITGASVCEEAANNIVFNVTDDKGYSVKTSRNSLIFTAQTDVEMLYAVYTFAEEILGFCFFEPGNDRFTPQLSITLDDRQTVISAREPLIKNRGLVQEFPFSEKSYLLADWMAKNRLNYLLTWMKYYDEMSSNLKKHFRIRGINIESGHHSFEYWIPAHKYYDQHPEFFAIIDGKRVKPEKDHNGFLLNMQLCATNKKLRAEIVKNMVRYCKDNPEVKTISLLPNDGFGWCECDNCSRFYDKSKKGKLHSVSQHVYLAQDLYHDMFNDIATQVKAQLSDVRITLAAYVNYSEPSKNFKLTKQTMLHFSPYWRCINHNINDKACPINSQYRKTLDLWRKENDGGEISIYEYFMGINLYVSLPMIHHENVYDEIRYYNSIGIDGILTQFHLTHWTAYGLNFYMMAKAAYGDSPAVIDKAFKDIFGQCADQAKQFYAQLKKLVQTASPCHIPYPRSLLNRTDIADYKKIYDLSKLLAAQAPDNQFIRSLTLWIQYLLKFKTIFDDYKAGEDVTQDIKSLLAWAYDHQNAGIIVIDKLEMLLNAWLECIKNNRLWYHFNLDWEDNYIQEHDTTLSQQLSQYAVT